MFDRPSFDNAVRLANSPADRPAIQISVRMDAELFAAIGIGDPLRTRAEQLAYGSSQIQSRSLHVFPSEGPREALGALLILRSKQPWAWMN
jgi:hypothetical protein